MEIATDLLYSSLKHFFSWENAISFAVEVLSIWLYNGFKHQQNKKSKKQIKGFLI